MAETANPEAPVTKPENIPQSTAPAGSPIAGSGLFEGLSTIRNSLPSAAPVLKWLTDPNAPPFDPNKLDPQARQHLAKIGSLFVGTSSTQIKAYLEENVGTYDKPGPLFKNIVSQPEIVINFVAGMKEADLAKMIKDNPDIMAKVQQSILEKAPTLTLSSHFNKKADGAMPAVQEILTTEVGKIDLKKMDTAAEVGDFFAHMPKEQIEKFVAEFKKQTDDSSWFWDGVDIKIKNYDDPAEVRKAITDGVQEAINYAGGDNPVLSPIRAGIQKSINSTLEGMKAGVNQMTPEIAAKHLIDLAKKPEQKDMLLDLISDKDGNGRRLKDEYQRFITTDLLMKNKDALVNSYIPQNLATQLNDFKQLLGQLPPEFQKLIGGFVSAVLPMIEKFMPSPEQTQTAAMPASGMNG